MKKSRIVTLSIATFLSLIGFRQPVSEPLTELSALSNGDPALGPPQ
jgi:hypothetical protein